jgi:hypothetical protein
MPNQDTKSPKIPSPPELVQHKSNWRQRLVRQFGFAPGPARVSAATLEQRARYISELRNHASEAAAEKLPDAQADYLRDLRTDYVDRQARQWGLVAFLSGLVVAMWWIAHQVSPANQRTFESLGPAWGSVLAIITVVAAGLSVLATVGALTKTGRIAAVEEELRNVEFARDLQSHAGKDDPQERRAEKLLSFNQHQLRTYYDLVLAQNRRVFTAGLFCVAAGLVVIGATTWLLRDVPGSTPTPDARALLIGGLGAIGAIMTNVVAAVYLAVHKKTAENLAAFHTKLVDTNRLFFANVVASRVASPRRDDVMADVARAVARVPAADDKNPS